MSSIAVRNLVKNFITTALPTEKVIDLSEEQGEFQDIVEAAGLVYPVNPWLGIDFISFDEYPVSIASTNTEGCYREEGTIMLFIVEAVNSVSASHVRDRILVRAENIRGKFRGVRINNLAILRNTPPNFKADANIEFEGGYTSAVVMIDFQYDIHL